MNYQIIIRPSFYQKLLEKGMPEEAISSKTYAIVSSLPRLLTIESSKIIEKEMQKNENE